MPGYGHTSRSVITSSRADVCHETGLRGPWEVLMASYALTNVTTPLTHPIRAEIYRALSVVAPSNGRKRRSVRLECRFYTSSVRRILKFSPASQKSLGLPRCLEIASVPATFNYDDLIKNSQELVDQIAQGDINPSDLGTEHLLLADSEASENTSLSSQKAMSSVSDHPPKRGNTSILGTLIDSGRDVRTIEGKTHNNFCIELTVDELGGAAQKLYGEDLQRALRDSGASNGDRIRVTHKGWTNVTLPGNQRSITRKKMYSIEVLRGKTDEQH